MNEHTHYSPPRTETCVVRENYVIHLLRTIYTTHMHYKTIKEMYSLSSSKVSIVGKIPFLFRKGEKKKLGKVFFCFEVSIQRILCKTNRQIYTLQFNRIIILLFAECLKKLRLSLLPLESYVNQNRTLNK